ncbi:MAG: hypothetical protein HY040_20285 [Planctomycetes bacterium]|nr:hypothetical protein [Planctomycetota bacterium]
MSVLLALVPGALVQEASPLEAWATSKARVLTGYWSPTVVPESSPQT